MNRAAAYMSLDVISSEIGILPPTVDLSRAEVTQLPSRMVWTIVGISALPMLLNMVGVDLGSTGRPLERIEFMEMNESQLTDAVYGALSGSFMHTILQSWAVSVAMLTVVLAFVHYRIKRDVTTPIIGMALFCAACMDLFRILAADRLIAAVADNRDLIPFTWAVSRLFNALILIVGVGLLLIRKREKRAISVPYAIGVSFAFGFIAYALIRYSATSSSLPQTQFPDSWIARPYDLIPLAMFLFGYVFVYRPFHRQQQTMFSHALVISVIPEIAAQLHVVFGSSTLFDNHFNAAHMLKVVAYGVPFAGLVFDYIHTYRLQVLQSRQLRRYTQDLEATKKSLELQTLQLTAQSDELQRFTARLEKSNRELEDFARIASHDLQEPLRKVQAFGDRLKNKFSQDLPEQGRDYVERMQNATTRMQDLINDLLTFSRVTTKANPFTRVDLSELIQEALTDLEVRIEETHGRVEVSNLPTLDADATQMRQLFQNLIGNALKYHRPEEPPVVRIDAQPIDDGRAYRLTFADNGIGFDPKFAQRIFAMFQRLHGRESYEGTGVGLAVCRKIVERHGGQITADSTPGQGSLFTVVLPVHLTQEETSPCPA